VCVSKRQVCHATVSAAGAHSTWPWANGAERAECGLRVNYGLQNGSKCEQVGGTRVNTE